MKTEHLVEIVVKAPQGTPKLHRYIVRAGTNQDAYRVVEDRYRGRAILDAYITSDPFRVEGLRYCSTELAEGVRS
jgi:hypothetical protein